MKKKELPIYHAQLANLLSAVVKRVKVKKEQTAPNEKEGVQNDGGCTDSQAAN